jgi:pimeloyl-ACP methyl ester carboxylesterase
MLKILLLLTSVVVAVFLGLWWFTAHTADKVEQRLPATGVFIDVPGARLHVIERGQGPALLLIHGLGGQSGHFTYGIVDQLAPHFRVIVIDRPGSGYSTRSDGRSASLEAQAAMLAALIDQMKLDRPFVVGHSLGGAIALALALAHPEKVSGLALVAPLTQITDKVSPAFNALLIKQSWLRTLVAWTVATPATMLGSEKLLGQIFGPEPVPPDFATRGGGLMSLRPSQFLAASADIQALPASLPQQQIRYGQLQLPVSVLYGRNDLVLDPTENGADFIAQVNGATLELVDGGHMLPVTNPRLTADFIRRAASSVIAIGKDNGAGATAP